MTDPEQEQRRRVEAYEAKERIDSVVSDLSEIPGVIGALITRGNGIVVSSKVPGGGDPNLIGAMSAAVLEHGNSCMGKLNLGDFRFGVIESRARVFLLLVVDELILTLLANRTVPIGFLSMRMREAAEEISELIRR